MSRTLFLMLAAVALAACVSAQTPSKGAGVASTFDSARAFADLKAIVAIGPRPAGSPGAAKTRDYIKKEVAAVGLNAVEQSFDADTPAGRIRMTNLIVSIPGSGRNHLVIGGHYDTKLFKDVSFVGANDAGSSTAFLIELARALKGRQNAVTIDLVFFDGEEAVGEWETGNTWGSQYYVESARKAGTLSQIKAMVLVDMIAEKNPTFKRESNSTRWLSDIVWSAGRKLNRPEFSSVETGEISDDHLPFLQAGIPSVDIIDLEYDHWHQPGDTLDKLGPEGLKAVGDVLLESLAAIELRIR